MGQRAKPTGDHDHAEGECGACDARRQREAEMEETRAWFAMKARLAPRRSRTALDLTVEEALERIRQWT